MTTEAGQDFIHKIVQHAQPLIKSRIIELFDYIVGTRFSIEQRLYTQDSIVGPVLRARVGILLPDSTIRNAKVEALSLRVSVFSSGNVMSSSSIDRSTAVSETKSAEVLTAAVDDVFNDFIETMRAQIFALD